MCYIYPFKLIFENIDNLKGHLNEWEMIVMNYKELKHYPKKCIGCRLCEQICTMTHFKVTNPSKALIRILRDDEKQLDSAIYCHTCQNAPCIEACQYDALSRNSNTNAINVDKDNCVACMECLNACPYEIPILHPSDNYILICDLCGGEPECVSICPENAIMYVEMDNSNDNEILEEN